MLRDGLYLGKGNIRWACVVKDHFILDVEVRAPMANLSRPFQFRDLEERVVMVVMDEKALLGLCEEDFISRGRNVVVMTVCESRARLSDSLCVSECRQVLGCGIRKYTG